MMSGSGALAPSRISAATLTYNLRFLCLLTEGVSEDLQAQGLQSRGTPLSAETRARSVAYPGAVLVCWRSRRTAPGRHGLLLVHPRLKIGHVEPQSPANNVAPRTLVGGPPEPQRPNRDARNPRRPLNFHTFHCFPFNNQCEPFWLYIKNCMPRYDLSTGFCGTLRYGRYAESTCRT
jgi:hypothetical protein